MSLLSKSIIVMKLNKCIVGSRIFQLLLSKMVEIVGEIQSLRQNTQKNNFLAIFPDILPNFY